MKIVIDIPETMMSYINKNEFNANEFNAVREAFYGSMAIFAIQHGTPLPKGHGRLIDADALVKKMEEREEKLKDDRSMWETAGVETALDMFAPTIIEADKEESEEEIC